MCASVAGAPILRTKIAVASAGAGNVLDPCDVAAVWRDRGVVKPADTVERIEDGANLSCRSLRRGRPRRSSSRRAPRTEPSSVRASDHYNRQRGPGTQSARSPQRKPELGGLCGLRVPPVRRRSTVVMTWPLAAGLTHDVPGDFGDPLFTSWVLSWDFTHLGRGWWNANIFAPHPLALAYSEHLLPQALQALADLRGHAQSDPLLQPAVPLDVRALGVRDVPARTRAHRQRRRRLRRRARVCVRAVSHRRTSRICRCCRRRGCRSCCSVCTGTSRPDVCAPLVGAAAAWLVQNLSCGYYLLFFSPIVGLYIAWELTRRELWRDSACARARGRGDRRSCSPPPHRFCCRMWSCGDLGFSPRSLTETRRFSADVYGYFTADPNLRLWGPDRATRGRAPKACCFRA